MDLHPSQHIYRYIYVHVHSTCLVPWITPNNLLASSDVPAVPLKNFSEVRTGDGWATWMSQLKANSLDINLPVDILVACRVSAILGA